MTLEFWNLCNFFYSFENYLILIVSIVYPYIMLLHILISENFKLWAFWSLNTISWSTKCFLATGQFAYFGWVWYSYCCQNLAVFTEPCHTPAAGSCKTLVLLVLVKNDVLLRLKGSYKVKFSPTQQELSKLVGKIQSFCKTVKGILIKLVLQMLNNPVKILWKSKKYWSYFSNININTNINMHISYNINNDVNILKRHISISISISIF